MCTTHAVGCVYHCYSSNNMSVCSQGSSSLGFLGGHVGLTLAIPAGLGKVMLLSEMTHSWGHSPLSCHQPGPESQDFQPRHIAEARPSMLLMSELWRSRGSSGHLWENVYNPTGKPHVPQASSELLGVCRGQMWMHDGSTLIEACPASEPHRHLGFW